MPGGLADLKIQLQPDPPDNLWFAVPLAVGDDVVFQAILNPGLPHSLISVLACQDVRSRGADLIEHVSANVYVLRRLKIQGQDVPDIEIRVSRAIAGLIGVDCILGFDFLQKFDEIHFFTRTLQAVLVDP